MRQLQDVKVSGEHIHLQQQIDEKGNDLVRTVHEANDSDKADTHHDAKEEGRNKYYGNPNGRKKSQMEEDGKVFIKNRGGFDFKI